MAALPHDDGDPAPPAQAEPPGKELDVPDAVDVPIETPVARVDERPYWFGWQVILADVLAGAAGWEASRRVGSTYPLLLMWSLAAPTVHGLHGGPADVAGTLALHVLLSLAGALIGASSNRNCDGGDLGCALGDPRPGALFGAIVATTIDAAFMSTEPPPLPSASRSRYMAMPPWPSIPGAAGSCWAWPAIFRRQPDVSAAA